VYLFFGSGYSTKIEDQYIIIVDDTFYMATFQQQERRFSGSILSNVEVISQFDFESFGPSGDADDEEEGIEAQNNFGNQLRGFTAIIKDITVLDRLRNTNGVKYVEQDQWVFASVINEDTTQYSKQVNASWNLARVSSRSRPLGRNYFYDSSAGEGVVVYVVDTGINIKHKDFEGRAKWGITIPKFDSDVDQNGHGTHCAGIIGGKTYGVAKKATMVAVKVLRSDGSGSISDVLSGIEWVVKAHKRVREGKEPQKSIISMSLGGSKSQILDQAVKAAYKAGVHVIVAAGNDADNSCDYSPSGSPYAISVGATTRFDKLADFSNMGKCVSILAPGKDIVSTWIYGVESRSLSGTSMAAPHVAGAAALILSETAQLVTPKDMKSMLIKGCTKKAIGDLPSKTSNCLLYTLNDDE